MFKIHHEVRLVDNVASLHIRIKRFTVGWNKKRKSCNRFWV